MKPEDTNKAEPSEQVEVVWRHLILIVRADYVYV